MGIVSYLFEKLTPSKKPQRVAEPIYNLSFNTIAGKEVKLSDFQNKNLLIVNTASKCGYTYQYEDLQQLHEKYGDKVTIIGFPTNDFLRQEPGNDSDIASFCQVNYGVTFLMAAKTTSKGKKKHPIFDWLEKRTGKRPSWNFCKYLITQEGNVVQFFPPTVKPLDNSIVNSLR